MAMAGNLERPRLLELFCVFARVSAVTVGGGYVMFPLLKSEVVDAKEWISDEELIDYYALAQSVPGIIAMNTSALIGYRKRGFPGAMAAAVGMATPSLLVILLIAAFLTPYFDNEWVQKAFAGIRSAVVAMIVMAVFQVARTSVNTPVRATIAVGSFLAIAGLGVHPAWMIIAGGLFGLVLLRREGRG
jgi:chromate transporter